MASCGKYILNLALQKLQCNEERSTNSDGANESFDEDDDTGDPTWCLKRKQQGTSSESEDENNNKSRTKQSTSKQTEDTNDFQVTDIMDQIDHEKIVSASENNNDTESAHRKRAKCGMRNEDNWQKNVNKKLRMHGKAYMGHDKVQCHSSFSKQRPESVLVNRGCTHRCEKWGKSRKCDLVTETTRQEIF